MPTNIIMPKQGLQMTEGLITQWLAKEGDRIEQGQPLFEMETDKLSITIDAPASGTLLKIVRGEMETVPVAEVVAILGEPGDAVAKPSAEPQPVLQPEPKLVSQAVPKDTMTADKLRSFATPRARTKAAEAGVACAALTGSGPGGLVIERDVIAAAKLDSAGVPDAVSGADSEEYIDITPMRRAIWESMMASAQGTAQARHRLQADMSEAMELRGAYAEAGTSLSYNDILVFTLCRALMEFPELNSSVENGRICRKRYVNMGLAVAVENGLVVPTIFNAHSMSMEEIHCAAEDLIAKARNGALMPREYKGGTFTLTNLGMLGIDEFDAILNPPQAAILAVGRIADTPVARCGQVVVRPMMRMTLTYDHRVVDGAPAAKFIRRVAALLEHPVLMLCKETVR